MIFHGRILFGILTIALVISLEEGLKDLSGGKLISKVIDTFKAMARCNMGDGKSTLFCTDANAKLTWRADVLVRGE
jgi:hypothetical protein